MMKVIMPYQIQRDPTLPPTGIAKELQEIFKKLRNSRREDLEIVEMSSEEDLSELHKKQKPTEAHAVASPPKTGT